MFIAAVLSENSNATYRDQHMKYRQYSMRTVLLIVAGCGLAIGWAASRLHSLIAERQAATLAESYGFNVEYAESNFIDRSISFFGRTVSLEVDDARVIGMQGTGDPQREPEKSSLTFLRAFPYLEYLNLTDCSWVGDDEMSVVGSLKSLEILSLDSTEVTDVGLARLSNLKCLESINISFTKTSSVGLRVLAELPQCKRISVGGTSITPDDVQREACRLNREFVVNFGFGKGESIKCNK